MIFDLDALAADLQARVDANACALYGEEAVSRWGEFRHRRDLPLASAAGEAFTPRGKGVVVSLHVVDGRVVDAAFQAKGCGHYCLAAEAACTLALGRPLGEAGRITAHEIRRMLGAMLAGEEHCADIAALAMARAAEKALDMTRTHPFPA